jgi:hypothetical protein
VQLIKVICVLIAVLSSGLNQYAKWILTSLSHLPDQRCVIWLDRIKAARLELMLYSIVRGRLFPYEDRGIDLDHTG